MKKKSFFFFFKNLLGNYSLSRYVGCLTVCNIVMALPLSLTSISIVMAWDNKLQIKERSKTIENIEFSPTYINNLNKKFY